MTKPRQLWLLTGGNGAGKSTLYRLFLAPRGMKFVNADLIARKIYPTNPEKVSYEAAQWTLKVLEDLVAEDVSFCYETVFSHPSNVDLIAKAKARGYEIIFVYIHLDSPELNDTSAPAGNGRRKRSACRKDSPAHSPYHGSRGKNVAVSR